MSYQVLYPSRMFDARSIDDDFAEEREAAAASGFVTGLVDQELLDAGAYGRAVRACQSPGHAIYRGWTLGVEAYAGVYDALARRGVELINSPAAYRHCHYLPESFHHISAHSPASVWVTADEGGVDLGAVVEAATVFGDSPVVVKDYVKSRKHE
jgi:hypothetical protein